MRVEFQGGPADGKREEAPDDISVIYLTDIGPAHPGMDTMGGASLGHMTYEITNRKTVDGAIIFQFAGATPGVPLEIQLKLLRSSTSTENDS